MAYAENQSMFLDSLANDADWMAKYCRSRCGGSGVTLPERKRGGHVLAAPAAGGLCSKGALLVSQ